MPLNEISLLINLYMRIDILFFLKQIINWLNNNIMYFIFFRNTIGRMCSTIHSQPLTQINIPTGNFEEDGNTEIYMEVPCKYIKLTK